MTIELDIEVGDVVLTGKFKNKRTIVKEIGTDELGQPTINGKPILKMRIEKLLPKNKQSKETREGLKEMAFSKRRFQKLAGILKEQAEPQDDRHRVIVSYYETWSPEDVEIGDTDDKGELDAWEVEVDEYDREEGLDHTDIAADYLIDKGVSEPSSSHFHPGIWYTMYGDSDFRTGDRTNESYHLKGFSEDEEKEVYEKVMSKLR